MLRVEIDGLVARLTLNRPEVRNALNDELIGRLNEAFSTLPPDVRVVILAGEGSAFCAGGDLQWMRKAATYTESQNYEDALQIAKLFEAVATHPAVVIARVQGPAFGGGCGLVACADVAIASPDALFALSEVRLGLVAATISPHILRKLGSGHARALLATGESFSVEKALRIGLIHEVVSPEELNQAVAKKARAVLSAGPRAVAFSKRMAQNPPMSIEESARALAEIRSGDEAREGVSAFLEKRKASYVVEL